MYWLMYSEEVKNVYFCFRSSQTEQFYDDRTSPARTFCPSFAETFPSPRSFFLPAQADGALLLASVQPQLPPPPQPVHRGRNGLPRAPEILRPEHAERSQRTRHRPSHPQQHGPNRTTQPAHSTIQLAAKQPNR